MATKTSLEEQKSFMMSEAESSILKGKASMFAPSESRIGCMFGANGAQRCKEPGLCDQRLYCIVAKDNKILLDRFMSSRQLLSIKTVCHHSYAIPCTQSDVHCSVWTVCSRI